MGAEHIAALLALIQAAGVTVYDGAVPDRPTLPYAVLYADLGTHTAQSLANDPDWTDLRFQVTSVGVLPASARIVAEKSLGALLGVRPTVPGRRCGPIRHDSSQPIQRDDDQQPPLFYATDQFTVSSVPASTP
jgi:hypothetical protein